MIAKVDLELDRDRFPAGAGRSRGVAARRPARARGAARARPVAGPSSRQRAAAGSAGGGWMRSSRSSTPRTGMSITARPDGDSDGRRFGKPAKPYSPPLVPEGKINVTDPDSREMRTQGQPNIQGYNAQAVVTEQQIIIAAEITTQSPDFGQLEPMVTALKELEQRRHERASADGAGRRRLLAPQPDRAPPRRRVPGARPARLDGPRGRPPRLGRRDVYFMRRVLAPISAASYTSNDDTASSRYSGRSSTTAG